MFELGRQKAEGVCAVFQISTRSNQIHYCHDLFAAAQSSISAPALAACDGLVVHCVHCGVSLARASRGKHNEDSVVVHRGKTSVPVFRRVFLLFFFFRRKWKCHLLLIKSALPQRDFISFEAARLKAASCSFQGKLAVVTSWFHPLVRGGISSVMESMGNKVMNALSRSSTRGINEISAVGCANTDKFCFSIFFLIFHNDMTADSNSSSR